MEKYEVYLRDTVATDKVKLQNVITGKIIYVPAISWTWVNSFAIKCKFAFDGEEHIVTGEATPLNYDF